MKKLIRTVMLLAAAGTLALCSLSVGAEETAYEFYGTPWTGTVSEDSSRYLTVYENAVITSDTELADKSIRIEKNGVLEITNGANVSLDSTNILIENGGALIISDGVLTLNGSGIPGSYVSSYGTLIAGSNGGINIKRGGLKVYPEGSFIGSGAVELVNKTGYSRVLSAIKRYDKSFRPSEYSIYAHSLDGKSAQIQLCYCIGDIETDYRYTASYGANSGVKLKRSPIKLSEVYDKELRERLLDSVHAYEARSSMPADFELGIERSYYYSYCFAKNTLTFEYLYFTPVLEEGDDEPVIVDNTHTFAVEIVGE